MNLESKEKALNNFQINLGSLKYAENIKEL